MNTKLLIGLGIILAVVLGGGYVLNKANTPAPLVNDTFVPPQGETNPAVTNSSIFTVEASKFSYSLKEIRVKKGDVVTINFKNVEGNHDWVLDEFNAKTDTIGAGEERTIQFTADQAGTFEYYCSVGNHRQMGMVGKLIVE